MAGGLGIRHRKSCQWRPDRNAASGAGGVGERSSEIEIWAFCCRIVGKALSWMKSRQWRWSGRRGTGKIVC